MFVETRKRIWMTATSGNCWWTGKPNMWCWMCHICHDPKSKKNRLICLSWLIFNFILILHKKSFFRNYVNKPSLGKSRRQTFHCRTMKWVTVKSGASNIFCNRQRYFTTSFRYRYLNAWRWILWPKTWARIQEKI